MAELGELLAEPLRFGKVDIADGVVISIGQLQRQLARQLSNDPSPLPLRRLEFGHPKALGQGHFDLNFARAPFGFAGWATHSEFAWRAPAKFDAGDLAFVYDCTPRWKSSSSMSFAAPSLVAWFSGNGVSASSS